MNKGVLYPRIYDLVRQIPKGRVATYGQIATMAGIPGHARQVGYALHSLPEFSDVPWHRVINHQGRISLVHSASLQRTLLEAEGVVFDGYDTIDLCEYQWHQS
jgi:methylated-DNA-protein-cysteine methyltransferase related protein